MAKDYTDSHGVSVKGKYGNSRYWIRTKANGSNVMSTVIKYDAFDYRSESGGLYAQTGSVMPSGKSFLSVEECEKILAKILKRKELA